VVIAVVALAVLIVGAWFVSGALHRTKNAGELAVKEQLYAWKFDGKDEHFDALDALGPDKVVPLAIKLLVDKTPAETAQAHSTTTTRELAFQYLLRYAKKIDFDAPTSAIAANRTGPMLLTDGQWKEQQELWQAWFEQAQAKGLVH
jgi:hypothetical protein